MAIIFDEVMGTIEGEREQDAERQDSRPAGGAIEQPMHQVSRQLRRIEQRRLRLAAD